MRDTFKRNRGLLELFKAHIRAQAERQGLDPSALDFDGYLDIEGTWNENLATFQHQYGLDTPNGSVTDFDTRSNSDLAEDYAAYVTNQIFQPNSSNLPASKHEQVTTKPRRIQRPRFRSNPLGVWESALTSLKPIVIADAPSLKHKPDLKPLTVVGVIKPPMYKSAQEPKRSWLREIGLFAAELLLSTRKPPTLASALSYVARDMLGDANKPEALPTRRIPSGQQADRSAIYQAAPNFYVGPMSTSKPCERCGKQTLWHQFGGEWVRLSVDGSRHRCR